MILSLLTASALSLSAAAAENPAPRPDVAAIRALVDTNGDGRIDAAERRALFRALREDRAQRAGGDQDRPRRDRAQRAPDRAERPHGRRPGPRARLDLNGDGRVGPIERRLALKRLDQRRGEQRAERPRDGRRGDRPARTPRSRDA